MSAKCCNVKISLVREAKRVNIFIISILPICNLMENRKILDNNMTAIKIVHNIIIYYIVKNKYYVYCLSIIIFLHLPNI